MSTSALHRLGQELVLQQIIVEARRRTAAIEGIERRTWNGALTAATEVFNDLKPRLRALGLSTAQINAMERVVVDLLADPDSAIPAVLISAAGAAARPVTVQQSAVCDKNWAAEFTPPTNYTRERCTALGEWRRTYYSRCGGNPRVDVHGSRRATEAVYNARRSALYCAYYFGSPRHRLNQQPTAAEFDALASRIPYAFGGRIPVATGDRGSTYLNTFEVQQRRREARPSVRGAPAAAPAATPSPASAEPVQPAR